MLKRLLRTTLASMAALALLAYLLPWGLYLWQIHSLPALPEATALAPELPIRALRLSLGDNPDRPLVAQTPWSLPLALLESDGTKGIGGFDKMRLAQLASRTWLRRQPAPSGSLRRHLREAAVSVWISRHWRAEQAASQILADAFYGPGIEGLPAASEHFFDLPADALQASEAAYLAILLRGPVYYHCRPERVEEQARRLLAILDPGARYAPRLKAC